MQSFIEEVQIYEQPKEKGRFLKSISFAFPVYYNDKEFTTIAFGEDALKEYANNLTKDNLVGWDKEITDETVCLLSKGDVKSKKIRVEFSLEDMDTDGFKKGATYNAIRDWIKEKYGYRVTNLNIAQVKQKHGIIERENYNKPKSVDSRQPGCPEEKVKAIEDAMRHFQMI